MTEKGAATMPIARARRPRCARPGVVLALVALGLYLFYHIWPLAPTAISRWSGGVPPAETAPKSAKAGSKLVPLEAHIMSKCPDARDCLRSLVLPAMMRSSDKVDFTLSFIGTPTENDGVDCKHGPAECLGNILELCAHKLYPDPKTYLGFVMCLERDYKDIPQRSLVEDCALEHAIDFEALNECATKDDGALGVDMLRKSVRKSSDAGVTKSCTVRLNEEVYCVRDDGKWKDCPTGSGVSDLVIAIEKLYRQNSSS